MQEASSLSPVEKIARCEELIRRFRQSVTSGQREEANKTFIALMQIVDPILIHKAHNLSFLPDAAVQEAYELMYNRLLDHLFSPTFPSMADKFGAYLKSLAMRVLPHIRAKYMSSEVSYRTGAASETSNNARLYLEETIADPQSGSHTEKLFLRTDLRQALAKLPRAQQIVFEKRLDGYENNTIAKELGISAATASRLYAKAITHLQELLQVYDDEGTND